MKTFKEFMEQMTPGKVGSDRLLGALMRKVHSDAQTKYDADKLKPQAKKI